MQDKTVIAIGANIMGSGSEELGKILIKAYIGSLTLLNKPPDILVFFNSGVFLTTIESNTVEDLKELVTKGTELLICGTCANYYGLQDKIAVGVVSNMAEISQIMLRAGNLVNIN